MNVRSVGVVVEPAVASSLVVARRIPPALWAFGLALAILLPWLGAEGFFDPWESHYAEVARQMVERGDPVHPFWKDAYFFSKPVLLFWMTAPLYAVIGLGGADAGSAPVPALTELCARLPGMLLSLFAVWWLHRVARRAWGAHAGAATVIVLVTTPLWFLMSRQAITDMPYVATAAAALLVGVEALLWPNSADDARWPRWFVVVVVAVVLPQLLVCIGYTDVFDGHPGLRMAIAVVVIVVGAAVGRWLARNARGWRWHLAAVLLALSCLAKGPVGAVLAGMVLLVGAAATGRWHSLRRVPWATATVLFVAVAAPWPIVMMSFHGLDDTRQDWFHRFVLYDLLGRVGAGVHGDRGGIEYYVRTGSFGLMPWGALVPFALAATMARSISQPKSTTTTPADALGIIASLWFVIVVSFFALTSTKFHHYLLPAAPPLALVCVHFARQLLRQSTPRASLYLLACGALPLAVLAVRELVLAPWELVDLFTYHYQGYQPSYYFPVDKIDLVDIPGGTQVSFYRLVLVAGAVAIALAAGVAGLWAWWRGKRVATAVVCGVLLGAVVQSVLWVQGFMPRANEHWSQRDLVARYHQERTSSLEPLIAFQMDWKGETFYSQNRELQVKKDAAELKRLVDRPGREFILVHTDRLAALRTAVGKGAEGRLRVLEKGHAKWHLVVIAAEPSP
jgi:4-amino-4-deoxy-L-arabinose transferase-like glycosyltransferase